MPSTPARSSTPSTPPATPSEVFLHSLRLLLDKDTDGWIGLWADDGVMEFPFAPPGWPTRLDGKKAIADYMRDYHDHLDVQDFPDVHFHQTSEPETVIVEMRGVGRMVQSDRPYEAVYIAVVTIRAGLFVSYRDYWSPLLAMEPGADFTGGLR